MLRVIRGGADRPREEHEELEGLALRVAAVVDRRARTGELSLDERDGAEPDEIARLDAELASEVDALCEWAATTDATEAVRATVDQLVRAHRERRLRNFGPDDPDGSCGEPSEYDALEVFYEVLADLCWMAELPARAAVLERRARVGHRVAREGEVAECTRAMRDAIAELGEEPWSVPSTPARLCAAHRLSVMGAKLREIARGMPADGLIRRAVRRAARASWALDHVRLVEARAVWAELDRAVAALERVLG